MISRNFFIIFTNLLTLCACGTSSYIAQTTLHCRAKVANMEYLATMTGSSNEKPCVLFAGNCVVGNLSYAPELLSSISCSQLSSAYKAAVWETIPQSGEASCESGEVHISLDKVAKTGELKVDQQTHPMECVGSTKEDE